MFTHTLAIALSIAASPADGARAEQLFRQGRSLLQEGRVKDACAAFEESGRLDPALGTLLNLAECEVQLGRPARAYARFQEVLAWSRRVRHTAREQVALTRLAELKPRVALVVVDAGPEALVEVDGQSLAAGTQVPFEPGPHEVRVVEAGRERRQTLELVAGDITAVRLAADPPKVDAAKVDAVKVDAVKVDAAPSAPSAPPEAVVTAAPKRWGSAALWVASALVLAVGLGGTFWSYATWQGGERQKPGGPDSANPTVSLAEYQRAAVLYPVSLAATAVGVAGAVLGAVFFFRGTF